MKYLILLIVILLCLSGCQTKDEAKLSIGLIKPSLDHLPLQYALFKNQGAFKDFTLHYFNSGWETNEALVNGKIDLAIMPFTYIWNDVSQDKKVRIISFFERESDGIIARKGLNDLESLSNARLGVLKNSTLEIIPELIFAENDIMVENITYFRTPMDMAAALNSGNVDALCYYVPPIFSFSDDYEIIYWLSEEFPAHTCCDIAATETAISKKKDHIVNLLNILKTTLEQISHEKEELVEFACSHYQLPEESIVKSLEHTKFILGLQDENKLFEQKAAEIMMEKGYITNQVTPDEVYHPIFP